MLRCIAGVIKHFVEDHADALRDVFELPVDAEEHCDVIHRSLVEACQVHLESVAYDVDKEQVEVEGHAGRHPRPLGVVGHREEARFRL